MFESFIGHVFHTVC